MIPKKRALDRVNTGFQDLDTIRTLISRVFTTCKNTNLKVHIGKQHSGVGQVTIFGVKYERQKQLPRTATRSAKIESETLLFSFSCEKAKKSSMKSKT